MKWLIALLCLFPAVLLMLLFPVMVGLCAFVDRFSESKADTIWTAYTNLASWLSAKTDALYGIS